MRKQPRSASATLLTLSVGALATALGMVAAARRSRKGGPVPREPALPFEEKTASVGGIKMRWLELGRGEPVVFVHGVPTSPELWRGVLPRLGGVRALAWEMVGYGASIPEGRGRDVSVAKQADYLAAWLEHLDLRPVLVGHDLGGGVIQNVAVRYPKRCRGLLLTNAVGYDSWPVPEVKALRAAGALVRRLPDPAVKLILGTLFRLGHDNQGVAAASGRLHWRHYARHGAGKALVRQARSLDVRDTLEVQDALPRLGVPARVVWGAADGFQRVGYGERFAHDLGTTLERIEGGKHFTPEDHPERIVAALDDLLQEVRARERKSPGQQAMKLTDDAFRATDNDKNVGQKRARAQQGVEPTKKV